MSYITKRKDKASVDLMKTLNFQKLLKQHHATSSEQRVFNSQLKILLRLAYDELHEHNENEIFSMSDIINTVLTPTAKTFSGMHHNIACSK